jgi:hypothetical protein
VKDLEQAIPVLQNGRSGLLWEGKISFFDFSFPNRSRRIDRALDRFFKEIEE